MGLFGKRGAYTGQTYSTPDRWEGSRAYYQQMVDSGAQAGGEGGGPSYGEVVAAQQFLSLMDQAGVNHISEVPGYERHERENDDNSLFQQVASFATNPAVLTAAGGVAGVMAGGAGAAAAAGGEYGAGYGVGNAATAGAGAGAGSAVGAGAAAGAGGAYSPLAMDVPLAGGAGAAAAARAHEPGRGIRELRRAGAQALEPLHGHAHPGAGTGAARARHAAPDHLVGADTQSVDRAVHRLLAQCPARAKAFAQPHDARERINHTEPLTCAPRDQQAAIIGTKIQGAINGALGRRTRGARRVAASGFGRVCRARLLRRKRRRWRRGVGLLRGAGLNVEILALSPTAHTTAATPLLGHRRGRAGIGGRIP